MKRMKNHYYKTFLTLLNMKTEVKVLVVRAYKRAGTGGSDWGEWVHLEIGESVEGVLINVAENIGQYGKTAYTIRELETNNIISMSGNSVLEDRMNDVRTGWLVKITRLEDKFPKQAKRGAKPYKNWEVQYDDEYVDESQNAPEVRKPQAAPQTQRNAPQSANGNARGNNAQSTNGGRTTSQNPRNNPAPTGRGRGAAKPQPDNYVDPEEEGYQEPGEDEVPF